MPVNPPAQSFTYLALGDSYTVGESVPTSESFPFQTVALLRQQQIAVADPVVIATTGWTTDELAAGIASRHLRETFDVVSLLIGVNNQYRRRSIEEYKTQFTDLLQQAIRFARGNPRHVVVISIPDWGVTPFAAGRDRAKIAREIDAFNEANQAIADQYQVHYLNITPDSRQAATNPDLIANDGLHPSAKEYGKWAVKLAAILQGILQ